MKSLILHISAALYLLWPGHLQGQETTDGKPAEVATDSLVRQPAGMPLRLAGSPRVPGYGWYVPGVGPGYGLPFSGPLHYGLNGQVGAGVRVGWGRHNPWRGASFFTDLGALYALPLSKDGRWTAALGGYYSNYRMWGEPVNRLGVTGMLDCRLNERLNLTGFVAHDFGAVGSRRPGAPLWWPCDYGLLGYGPATIVGADLGIRVTEKFALSIGISMTHQQTDF